MKIVYISNLVVDNALCQEIVEIVETGCQLLVNQIQMHMIFSFILLFMSLSELIKSMFFSTFKHVQSRLLNVMDS